MADTLPKLFIGSSSESLPLVEILREALSPSAAVTTWNDPGVFKPTDTYLESLLSLTSRFDFGLFLFEPDDYVLSRGVEAAAPRDNVTFELGLFMERFGRKRALALAPRGRVRVLSDLAGLKLLEYDLPAEIVDLRQSLAKETNETTKKFLASSIQALLKPALARSIADIVDLLGSGCVEPPCIFADAPNVIELRATLRNLIKESMLSSGKAMVRHLAVDMSEAWGILENEVLQKDNKNINWLCLMMDPESPEIQKLASPTVSVDIARARIADMQKYLAKNGDQLAKRGMSFECRAYSHPPFIHGFLIEGKALLLSTCDLVDGQLDGSNTQYWRLETADEDAPSWRSAQSFEHWFDHCWEASNVRRIWPSTLSAVAH